jgi:2-polyprenyl-3-methyl-5-hydroxy-6-metoxy-1,4-benzoquinol methylase
MVVDIIRRASIKGKVLDFGAGRGELIQLLDREGGMQLHGADIMDRPSDLPPYISWTQQDLNDHLVHPLGPFDAIVCSEVIEHLENPRSTFRNFFDLLVPNGRLILTMPNQESVRSYITLVFHGHFAYFRDADYPAHITALLRADLGRISQESGFSEPLFYYTNHGWMPITKTTWQKFSINLLQGRLFSDNLGMIVTKVRSQSI